jgi:hypothetical protein
MAYAPNLFTNDVGRVGSNLHANDATALFLKKFAGEVMTVFDEKNIMKPLHTIRTITKGKSAQFPIIGTANAGYYSPGQDILDGGLAVGDGISAGGGLNKFKQTETLIHIDKVLMSSTFIASVDELVSHFDVRAPYTHQLGEALANQFDKNVLKVAMKTGAAQSTKAATNRSTANADQLLPAVAWIPGQTKRGSVVYSKAPAGNHAFDPAADAAGTEDLWYNGVDQSNAGADAGKLRGTPTASYLRKALFESARLLDEKDVPSSDRYCILNPAQYYELINNSENTDVVNSIINRDVGGVGSVSSGTLGQVAGITILVSNHIPTTDQTGGSGANANKWSNSPVGSYNDYHLNYTDIAGIVFQKGGFATLKLMDLAVESEYLINRQGNLFVSKYSMGHGALRPESVVVWSDGQQVGQAS